MVINNHVKESVLFTINFFDMYITRLVYSFSEMSKEKVFVIISGTISMMLCIGKYDERREKMSINPVFLGNFEEADNLLVDKDRGREYKEHFVAFLDILGFKHTIENCKCNEIYKILDEIRSEMRGPKPMWSGIVIDAYKHIHYRILSDSIILFIETTIEDSFPALIDVCTNLQTRLASLDEPVLLRGGISKGDLYYEMDMIYGTGLTKAYHLESNMAKYPRIVFLGETWNAGLDTVKYMYIIKMNYVGIDKEEDEIYFIDYLRARRQSVTKQKEYYDKLLSKCKQYIDSSVDASLREKYIWLNNRIKRSILTDDILKETYSKEKEEDGMQGLIEWLNSIREKKKQIAEQDSIEI